MQLKYSCIGSIQSEVKQAYIYIYRNIGSRYDMRAYENFTDIEVIRFDESEQK